MKGKRRRKQTSSALRSAGELPPCRSQVRQEKQGAEGALHLRVVYPALKTLSSEDASRLGSSRLFLVYKAMQSL